MLQLTPFAVAWTLAAVYCAVLLVAAVRIGIRLAKDRCAVQTGHFDGRRLGHDPKKHTT